MKDPLIPADASLGLECWPYRQPFTISRATLTEQYIGHASLRMDGRTLQGEGELHESDLGLAQAVLRRAQAAWSALGRWPSRAELRKSLPADGARNALDALLWDVECKQHGQRAWERAGIEGIDPGSSVATMITVTLGSPGEMAEQARRHAAAPVIKLKLGGSGPRGLDDDVERCFAVAAAAPGATLTVDPNEAWDAPGLKRFAQAVRSLPLALIEQPLPGGQEDLYPSLGCPVPLAADESCTTLDSLPALAGRVQVVNIKLDKCGGLTEALLMCDLARKLGLRLMVGCNCGTSLAMAPAFLVAAQCEFVDLDGPLHMQGDREPAMAIRGHRLFAPAAALWG